MIRLVENSWGLQSRYFRTPKHPPLACDRHRSSPRRAVTSATLAGCQPTRPRAATTRSKRHRRDWLSFIPFHRTRPKPWTQSMNCSQKVEFARERPPPARSPPSRRSRSTLSPPTRERAQSARAARFCSSLTSCSDTSLTCSGLAFVCALHELQASIAVLRTTR
jgi:hypothetical protein